MAVDSREKRASAIAFAVNFETPSIDPDGAIDEPERAFSVMVYSGIDIDEGGDIVYPPTVGVYDVEFVTGGVAGNVDGNVESIMGQEK